MERLVRYTRLSVLLVQYVTFNVGLAHAIHLPPAQPFAHQPVVEQSSHDHVDEAPEARRPPRWPGRSKTAKGLAIREASAFKPLARVL